MTPTPDPLREAVQAYIDHVVDATQTHTGCPERLTLDRALTQPAPALDRNASLLRELDACKPLMLASGPVHKTPTFSGWNVPDWLMQRVRAALRGDPA